jgi:hypothetical protein
MTDVLFRLSLATIIVAMTYGLYVGINLTIKFEPPEKPMAERLHPTFSEMSFVFVSWLCFLLLVNMRLLLLVSFVVGQASLYTISPEVKFGQYIFPTYVMIAGNCLYLMMLYFFFAGEKWSSGSLEGASEKYSKHD